MKKLLAPREAATILGISYPTLKQPGFNAEKSIPYELWEDIIVFRKVK